MDDIPLSRYNKSLRKMSHEQLVDELERLAAEHGIAEFELSAAVNIPKGSTAIVTAQRRVRLAWAKIKLALAQVRHYSQDVR